MNTHVHNIKHAIKLITTQNYIVNYNTKYKWKSPHVFKDDLNEEIETYNKVLTKLHNIRYRIP